MADNINVDPGTGVGAVPVATDDVSGVQYQVIKMATGGNGVATPVSTTAPIPTELRTSAGVAATYGAGAVDSGTLRVSMAGQTPLGRAAAGASDAVVLSNEDFALIQTPIDNSLGANRTIAGGSEYQYVAASQTDTLLGSTGVAGDYLETLICVVSTAATSQVQIKDGNGTARIVLPNAVGGGIGTYPISLGIKCTAATTPGWRITTAAGVAVLATGNFT